MMKRVRQTTILLLMLFIQLQPVQVHAVILDAEQDGHVAGTLSHTHAKEQLDSYSDSGKHQSDCHPVHTLSPPFYYEQDISLPLQNATEHLSAGLLSIDLALDLPPPKHAYTHF